MEIPSTVPDILGKPVQLQNRIPQADGVTNVAFHPGVFQGIVFVYPKGRFGKKVLCCTYILCISVDHNSCKGKQIKARQSDTLKNKEL